MVTVDVAVMGGPEGGVPVAVPVLVMDRAVTSAAVVVYVAVQISLAPAARVVLGQLMADSPAMGSLTETEVRVVLPVFVTL
jgi:hypothetical protein